ncbi:TPA: hypothetical protein ACJILP_000570 [Enterobacter ludwigii]
MAWQGVPFLHQNLGFLDSGVLTLSKIPLINVDTGFGWDAIAASLVAALVGGAIPAYISWKAIKNNNDALMLDRKVQNEITSRQLSNQQLYASRQQWIGDVRESAAKFIGFIQQILNYHNRAHLELFKTSAPINADLMNELKHKLHESFTEITFYNAKLELFLNPAHEISKQTSTVMTELLTYINNYEVTGPVNYEYTDIKLQEFKQCISILLKEEWERIKAY